jgi:DNA-binding NarL/FixJ family response regulator
MRVFLVEDSRILAPHLIEMIEGIPGAIVVGHAVDARTAIEAIARLRAQVAIVDISLRAGNGFDVVKSFARLDRAPVSIFLTNYVSAPVRAAATRLGVDHFFDKARDIDRLIVTLTELAARPDMRNGSDG